MKINKKLILDEIALFEKNANYLPQKKDIEILKKIRAVWVISGSGSYFKPLINVKSDQINRKNLWYHGTDKARLDYAQNWLIAYKKLLRKQKQPFLIYNGLPEQIDALLCASKNKLYKIPPKQIYIAPGVIVRTIDQVKSFSFPPHLNIKDGYLGVVTHAPHLARTLKFMAKNQKLFKNIKVIALPIKPKTEMIAPEIKGILDYIEKGEASNKPYPYQLLDTKNEPVKIEISPIIQNDLMNVFRLSNQKSVRANSFQNHKIKLIDHKKWFQNKFNNPNVVMLKAVMNKQFVGQIRLESEENQAIIGVSVDENFRGYGIALKLLEKAIKVAKTRKISQIEAYIKIDNKPSINLFSKAGFIINKKTIMSGNRALKYVYKIK